MSGSSNVIPFPARRQRGLPDGWPSGAAGEKLESYCRDMLQEIHLSGRRDTIEAVRVRGLKLFKELNEIVQTKRRLFGTKELPE